MRGNRTRISALLRTGYAGARAALPHRACAAGMSAGEAAAAAAPAGGAKPKKKICCACPETKRPRDEVRLQPREHARARARSHALAHLRWGRRMRAAAGVTRPRQQPGADMRARTAVHRAQRRGQVQGPHRGPQEVPARRGLRRASRALAPRMPLLPLCLRGNPRVCASVEQRHSTVADARVPGPPLCALCPVGGCRSKRLVPRGAGEQRVCVCVGGACSRSGAAARWRPPHVQQAAWQRRRRQPPRFREGTP